MIKLKETIMKNNYLSIEDMCYLFGVKNKKRPYSYFEARTPAKIQGENDWMDGKDAKDNPYMEGTQNHRQWYEQWLLMNKYC